VGGSTRTGRHAVSPVVIAVVACLMAVGTAPAAGHAVGDETAPTPGPAAVAASEPPGPPPGCPPASAEPHGFADTGTTHAAAIDCLAWLEVVHGSDASTFGTDLAVTRGQLATMVVRIGGLVPQLPDPTLLDAGFSDIEGATHQAAIEWLAALDPPVLRGFPDGTFRPGEPVLRAQAASVLARWHGFLTAGLDTLEPLPASEPDHFPDVASDGTHADAIGSLTAAGLLLGRADGRFHPTAHLTRGQTASLLARHLGLMVASGAVVLPGTDPDPDPDPDPPGNPWLGRHRIANIAHAGGIHEAPQNTLYAFATAQERGADVLEMDLQVTADGHVVVIHDSTVDRTTNGQGCVVAHTLEELRELDAAYTHVDGEGPRADRPEDDYRYRGIATGDAPPPTGFGPAHFRIPTLDEVLTTHAGQLINVEIKPIEVETRGGVTHDCPAVVAAMDPAERPDIVAEVARLIEHHDVAETVLVASFIDELMGRFVAAAPQVATSFPLLQGVLFFIAFESGSPTPPNPDGHAALQIPLRFDVGGGSLEISREFVDYAHVHGVAVHVWTINDPDEMARLIDWGVDGIITDEVRLLDQLLTDVGAPRP
jgi:glycerophosphoryl diester phosphodiesterase